MTEYKKFDDYVRNVFKIEPTELTHISPEEQIKQKAEEWMRNNSERCTKENMKESEDTIFEGGIIFLRGRK